MLPHFNLVFVSKKIRSKFQAQSFTFLQCLYFKFIYAFTFLSVFVNFIVMGNYIHYNTCSCTFNCFINRFSKKRCKKLAHHFFIGSILSKITSSIIIILLNIDFFKNHRCLIYLLNCLQTCLSKKLYQA